MIVTLTSFDIALTNKTQEFDFIENQFREDCSIYTKNSSVL